MQRPGETLVPSENPQAGEQALILATCSVPVSPLRLLAVTQFAHLRSGNDDT